MPVSLLTYLADDLVAVHGQADQQQLLRPGRQRRGARPVRRPRARRLLADYQRTYQRHRKVRAELDELISLARERAREAEDLRHGLEEIERAEPAEGEDIELQAEAERLTNADTLHNGGHDRPRSADRRSVRRAYDSADVVSLLGSARSALEAAATP